MNYVDRPQFSEGQLLSATDLQLAVDYPRDQLETHGSVAHVSGVIDGLALQIAGSSAVVAAGLAVDGQGRQLLLEAPAPLAADPLVGQPAGNYPAYIWYTEAPLTTALAPLNPCANGTGDQIRETPMVGIFLSAAAAATQAPAAVCLGFVGWDGTSLKAATSPTMGRQGGGVRAQTIVAPEHAVAVNGEDQAPTTFSVAGTLQAVASADGTSPTLAVPGGALVFSAAGAAAATSTVELSFNRPSATGNGLVINLGNNDPTSSILVASAAGTPLVTLDGSGTVTANQTTVQTLIASQNVKVTAGTSTLTLGPTPPSNNAGVSASDTLLLACGSNSGDQVQFLSGSNPLGTIAANGLTMQNVQVGQLATNTLGIGITNTADLHLQTSNGDVFVNPGNQASAPFRFTAQKRLVNQTVSPAVDVTPLAVTGGNGSAIQLGSLCIAFGTTTASLRPLTQSPPAITFPVTFASPPAFFVEVSGSVLTLNAVTTAVTATNATYRIMRMSPSPPTDGSAAAWSNTAVNVTVSWVALGSTS